MAGTTSLSATLPFLSEESSLVYATSHFLTSGGREAIAINPAKGLNTYFVPATPLAELDYASSFANCITPGALASAQRVLSDFAPTFDPDGSDYATQLEKLRLRLRECYGLPHSVDIVFAASGADAEYVPLALGCREDGDGIDNIMLGLDEVDPECRLSAAGLHISGLSPLGKATDVNTPVDAALADKVRLVELPLREPAGDPIPPDDIVLSMAAAIEDALRAGRHPIVRIVHGSATGLVVPSLQQIDALRRRYGHKVSLIVDASQGRIGRDYVAAFLSRGASIIITGSKFIGGPPTSAFVLVPASARSKLDALPAGFGTIFSRHEWTASWLGVERLPDATNMGLLLRQAAAIFELELFCALDAGEVRRVVHQFNAAAKTLARDLGFGRVSFEHSKYANDAQPRPLELQTSIVMDTSRLKMADDFLAARGLHLQLISAKIRGSTPVRLGPPIKCLKLPDGRYAGNLTLSLSMPQIVALAGLETSAIADRFEADFKQIAKRIRELT